MNDSTNLLGNELNKMLKSLTKYAYGPLGAAMNDSGGGMVLHSSNSRVQKRGIAFNLSFFTCTLKSSYFSFVCLAEVEYASSLPLQVALYFNVYFSVVWAIGTCFLWPLLVCVHFSSASSSPYVWSWFWLLANQIYRTNDASRVWVILILFAFLMMVLFEVVRLYLAYVGNLSERVSVSAFHVTA